MNRKYALMWSGGKDCALALGRARAAGLAITRLLTLHDPASGRVRFHNTALPALAAQGAALGVDLVTIPCPWAEMDRLLQATLRSLRGEGFHGVVFGNIHLVDVRSWYEERVRGAGLDHVEPIWGEEPAALLNEFITRGGRAILTCTQSSTLGPGWLGRSIDRDFARDVSGLGIDPCGENGEYHSYVTQAPEFAHALEATPGGRRREGDFDLLDFQVRTLPPPTPAGTRPDR